MKRSLLILLLCCPFLLNGSCTAKADQPKKDASEEEQTQNEEPAGPVLALVSPADGFSIKLELNKEYVFEWEPFGNQNFYRIFFSRTQDMAQKAFIAVQDNPAGIKASDLNAALKEIGLGSGETAEVYWSVGPWSESAKYTPQVRKLRVTAIEEDPVSVPVTTPIKVKVAVVIEDPVFNNPSDASDPRNGKRIHEIEGWNDPWKQLTEYAADFEEVSHGAVDIEIVETHDSPKMFCYTASTANGTREYMTPIKLYERYLDPDPENGKAHIDIDGRTLEYDYVAMMDEFGLSAKVDAGTINEVWVYNHPACKMNESRFMGEKGFWCNSGPINYGTGRNNAHNRKLVCVMFCNYERTVDLALHSFAHRVESIMSQLNYNNFWGFSGNSYSKYGVFTYVYEHVADGRFSGREEDLIPFDKFFAHGTAYDAVGAPGYAHIGTCHCPCNTDEGYIYWDKNYIYTFADEWLNYPYIHSDREKARRVNCEEWNDPKGWQYGYMKWFYKHIPHFEGINTYDPRDMHMNNWWPYLFDYYGALEMEAELKAKL